MYRKNIKTMVIVGIVSAIYIIGIESYSRLPLQMSQLGKRIEQVQIASYSTAQVNADGNGPSERESQKENGMHEEADTSKEAGIQISGIVYGETLTADKMLSRTGKMVQALSHEDSCSKLCILDHSASGMIERLPLEKGIGYRCEGQDETSSYVFTIKNQKDTQYNSYYELKIKGKGNMEHLDNLKGHAETLFGSWKVKTKQFIYFKEAIQGKTENNIEKTIALQLFDQLNAAQTNYYEDDRNTATCSYYGYCPFIDEYYKEENGYRSNMQIAFHYDEINDQTEMVVAFPFYNEVF